MSIMSVSGVSPLAAIYNRPRANVASLDPSPPTALLSGPEIEVVHPQPSSYDQMRGYLLSLHLNLNAAPPGRETAPPSPKQAAIDAYTGR